MQSFPFPFLLGFSRKKPVTPWGYQWKFQGGWVKNRRKSRGYTKNWEKKWISRGLLKRKFQGVIVKSTENQEGSTWKKNNIPNTGVQFLFLEEPILYVILNLSEWGISLIWEQATFDKSNRHGIFCFIYITIYFKHKHKFCQRELKSIDQ